MSFSAEQVLSAYDHFSHNWSEVKASVGCVCSFCLAPFGPSEVTQLYEEVDGITFDRSVVDAVATDTVRCPQCHLPYVLGDATGLPLNNQGFVRAVHNHWHT